MQTLERGKCKIPGCNCIVDLYRIKDNEWKCFDLCQKHRKQTKKEHIIDKHILKPETEFNSDGIPLCMVSGCTRIARNIRYHSITTEQLNNLDSSTRDLLLKLGIRSHTRGKLCEFHARNYDQYSSRLEKKREYTRLRNYNLTKKDYLKMLEDQHGKCKICGTTLIPMDTKTHIDHNHTTGKVTALLCSSCNTGIGMLKHNKDIAKAASKFLAENYK